MYLVRKIAIKKWDSSSSGADKISADAVTGDLRTSGNSLSLWCCQDSQDSQLQEVVLALASVQDRPQKIDIAWIEKQEAEDKGIKFKATAGNTVVENLQEMHIDAIDLDLGKLGLIAELIADAVRNKLQIKRFSVREVSNLIKDAVETGRINPDNLKDDMKKKLDL